MFAAEMHVGDRVGIKESADFAHWATTGSVLAVNYGADGAPTSVDVKLDSGDGTFPMLPSLLVVLGQAGGHGAAGGWSAQAFPTNGDAPGMLMYFMSGADVLAFVHQFKLAETDETLKVTPPPGAADAELRAIMQAGGVIA